MCTAFLLAMVIRYMFGATFSVCMCFCQSNDIQLHALCLKYEMYLELGNSSFTAVENRNKQN